MLLWVDIQRKMQSVNKFVSEEITGAKELLWRTAGELNLGKLVKRRNIDKLWK